MKKSKTSLRANSVVSDGIHVGIELELTLPAADGGSGHDDEACSNGYSDRLNDMSAQEILRDYQGLSRDEASIVARYFNADLWVSDQLDDWNCDDCDCAYNYKGLDRDAIAYELKLLTGNQSFKVVEDSSIEEIDGRADAEVCWNYYISKTTVKDNDSILKFLKDKGAQFDTSCGLHINLNNYLKIDETIRIATESLEFLFNVVAPSRRKSNYCKNYGMADEKYSMIYNQGDRLEFRFFSPTLEADKLNHYVTLANVIYHRLAGKNKKLPKKTEAYLMNKMTTVNGLFPETARETIALINSINSAESFRVVDQSEEEAA